MPDKKFEIGKSKISSTGSTFIIAELSANHLGKFDIAEKTIRAAAQAGVDAVKLQTYTADTLTLNVSNKHFVIDQGSPWDGKRFYELYEEAAMPWEWQPKLKAIANDIGMECFSSPFDASAVDFLEEMGVPAYKIASFEIQDIPLIEYVAGKMKPVIISTGIASREDIELAVETCRRVGNNQIALLKCTSAYPAPFSEMNLATIPLLAQEFDTLVGLSDHSPGIVAACASIPLGAKIIEKHFILDRSLGGPDASFSLEPDELTALVTAVRQTEDALGVATFELSEKAKSSRKFGRSLFVTQDVKAGTTVTKENVRSVRPADGLPPRELPNVLGKSFTAGFSAGTPLSWDMLR